MTSGRVRSFRALPTYAFGRRDPLFWGTLLLVAMEATTLALLVMSYFYARQRVDVWPTTAPGSVSVALGLLASALLLASVAPAVLMTRAAYVGDLSKIRWWLGVVTLLSLLVVVARGFELHSLPFRWDTDVYASMVFGLLVLHTLHLAFGVVENVVFFVLFLRGPVEKKHLADIEVNGAYWYFVVFGSLVVSGVIYGEALFR